MDDFFRTSLDLEEKTFEDLRQIYVLKAIEYISEEQRTVDKEKEIFALFQEPVDINLHPQLFQLMEYFPRERITLSFLRTILPLFKNGSYAHRSHVIKSVIYIPMEKRTVEFVQKMSIFFQQVASGPCRHDIFHELKKIPKEERYGVIDSVAEILRDSKEWFLFSNRIPDLLEAIYRIDPCKRAEVILCCQQYPIIFLQEDIFSAMCWFCPALEKTEEES